MLLLLLFICMITNSIITLTAVITIITMITVITIAIAMIATWNLEALEEPLGPPPGVLEIPEESIKT